MSEPTGILEANVTGNVKKEVSEKCVRYRRRFIGKGWKKEC